MLIGVLGDSHKNMQDIDRGIKKLTKAELIIHTGDMLSDAHYIRDKFNIPVIGVRGNCDLFIEGEDEIIHNIDKFRLFISHGHKYGVKNGYERIFLRGKELNANIVIFGHTHIPFYEKRQDIYLLNPGSLSIPRGQSTKSIAQIELNKIITIKHVGI